MSRSGLAAAVGIVIAVVPLRCLEVVLAPLALHDEGGREVEAGPESRFHSRPDSDLLAELARQRPGAQPIVRRMNPATDDPPRSLLEAARLCEAHAYPYLLYGYLRRTDFSYQAEIKLFDREAGEIAAVFFAGDDRAHYQRLVADVASKILAYFEQEIGWTPEPRREPEGAVLRVPCALGAWIPVSADWNRVAVGFAAAAVGLRYVPPRPLFTVAARRGYTALGLDLEYALAGNRPGYEGFFLHAARVRLPIEACLEVAGRHSIGLGVGPLLAVDTMAQDRLYADLAVETSAAAGLSLLLSYRYALSPRTALGLSNVLDWVAYAQPLVSWSPRLFADFRLMPAAKEAPHE